MKKQPEMLMRYAVAETLINCAIVRAKKSGDWESGVREIDQLMAAATLRGEQLEDTTDDIMNAMWAEYEKDAERKFPGDKRILNRTIFDK